VPQSLKHTPAERRFFEAALASLPSVPFACRNGHDPQRAERTENGHPPSIDEEASVAFLSGAPDVHPTETGDVRPTPTNGFGHNPNAGASRRPPESPKSGCPPAPTAAKEEDATAPATPSQASSSLEEQQAELVRLLGFAHNIKHMSGPAYLAATAGYVTGNKIPPEAFRVYLDRLLRDSGNPSDPIERMLIEQIALAHHAIGRHQTRAANAQSPNEGKTYSAAATALLGEFRRLTLTLKKYREASLTPHVTVVKQQNLAQNQQVAFVQGNQSADVGTSAEGCHPEKGRPHTELGSKRAIEYVPEQNLLNQSQACRGRQEEPLAAKRAHPRRPREAPTGCACQPPLEVLDRPADGGGKGSGSRQLQKTTDGTDLDKGTQKSACRGPRAAEKHA
jgi:hypothetical protein